MTETLALHVASRPRSLVLAMLLAALAAVANRALADEPAGEPRRVTHVEALAAVDRLPEMAAARAREQGAEAGLRVAGAWGAPEVSFQTNSINAREAVSLSVPLPLTRGPRVAAARADLLAASRTRAETLSAPRRAVRVAWFTQAAGGQP